MIPGKQYDFVDILAIARRRRWLITLPLVIGALATAVVTQYLPNTYRSETLILVEPQRVSEGLVKSILTGRIEDRLHSITQQILSRTRLERIIDDIDLYQAERRTMIMEDIVEQMRANIDVEIVKGDAFRVAFTGDDPRTVMKVTERLASLFIEENLRAREVQASGTTDFIESQLEEARRQLVENERRLEEYRRRFAGQLPDEIETNLQVIQNAQMQIQALNESTTRDRDQRLAFDRQLADAAADAALADPGQGGDRTGTPSPTAAEQELEQARAALRQLQLRLKPEHPDIVRLQRTIITLEAKAADASSSPAVEPAPVEAVAPGIAARRNRITELRAQLDNIDRQIARKEAEEQRLRKLAADYQARVEATPTRQSELVALMRDYDVQQKNYASLLAKREEAKIATNLERRQIGEQFKVLDPARMPEKPYSPNRVRLNLLGALVGLALGIALTALLEIGDTTLKTHEDVVQTLALPVLALVPQIVSRREERRDRRRRRLVALASSVAIGLLVAILVVINLGS